MHETNVIIQLADSSNIYFRGVVKDALMKVHDLVFPCDFYVMDMNDTTKDINMLLGRPFLKTPKAKIDVEKGFLTLENGDKMIEISMLTSFRTSINLMHMKIRKFL